MHNGGKNKMKQDLAEIKSEILTAISLNNFDESKKLNKLGFKKHKRITKRRIFKKIS